MPERPYVETTVPPRLHRPEDVAAVLGCSAWWVKDRARRRLIPYTRVGRAYRFTADHLAEIIRLNEKRPALPPQRHVPDVPSRRPVPEQRASQRAQPLPEFARLRARPPRRARQDQYDTAA